jgi:hypothetical protein
MKELRINQKNHIAYFRMGVLLLNENPIKAKACFKECQEIDPSFRSSDINKLMHD